MKTIGIVGSRRRDTLDDLLKCGAIFSEMYEDGDRIVSGGCPAGGDRFAEIIAEMVGATEENGRLIIHRPVKPPPGSPRYAYTKANYARNTLIANDADVLIGVVAEDRKGGTENTIKTFEKRGLKAVLA